jgi:hypothetical protein
MDESSLSDAILNAISENVGSMEVSGLVGAFVVVSEIMWENGAVTTTTTYPPEQPLSRTLGLIGYGEEWIRDDVRNSFLAAAMEDGEE